MKRILFLLVAWFLLTTTILATTQSVALSPLHPYFTKQEAIAKVSYLHPDYPSEEGVVKEIKTPVGPFGGYSNGTMTVRTQKIARDAYEITFTKEWNQVVNGVLCIDQFTYLVTRSDAKLIKSVQNADRIRAIK